MILPRYRIADSCIAGAGQGLILEQPVQAGTVIVAPDAIERVYRHAEILASPALCAQFHASARWFEDYYTLSPEWPDECYLNHSFRPTGLWHLGFVFALKDFPQDTEITIDYRHLLPPGVAEDFLDADTGATIVGLSWHESLKASTRALADLFAGPQTH